MAVAILTVDAPHWERLDTLLHEMHDHDFDLGGATYIAEEGLWRIPCSSADTVGQISLAGLFRWLFSGARTRQACREPLFDRLLTVSGVRACQVDDRARICQYTLNVIRLNREKNQVVIHFNEACKVLLDVEPGFVISLEAVR